MKNLKGAALVYLVIPALYLGVAGLGRAQILVGGAAAPAQNALSPAVAPGAGTFWSAQLDGPPWPFDPLPALPLYRYGPAGSDVFIFDDRSWDWTTRGSASGASGGLSGGVHADDLTGPGIGGSVTNSPYGTSYPMPLFTTNDLWLEMDGVTNHTVELVIHPPWNVTNGVYDLQYATDVSPGLAGLPISWQWLTRTAPGQTHVYPTNASDTQGFYRVGGVTPSAGTNFWIAFPFMYNVDASRLKLYVSSQASNYITVSNANVADTSFPISFPLAAGAITNVLFANSPFVSAYDMVTTNGIHVLTTAPAAVYVIYDEPAASTAFTGYPASMLGTNYCILARPANVNEAHDESEFAVVATANGTTVTITPSPMADLPDRTNAYSITRDEGDTYQISSFDTPDDVTGTLISSTAPIAVFAGDYLAEDPVPGITAGNPLLQQQLPTNSWGTQALAVSFGRPGGDIYRVLGINNNTMVTNLTTNAFVALSYTNQGFVTNSVTGGMFVVTLTNAQDFYDVILDGPVQFQASTPVQIAQFARGGDTDPIGPFATAYGDPCEILLPNIGHYLTSYTIATAGNTAENSQITNSFLNLIVPQSAISSTFLDSTNVSTNLFMNIFSSGYAAARIAVADATNHTVSSSQPFEVQVYGFGDYDAYGYLGGITTFP